MDFTIVNPLNGIRIQLSIIIVNLSWCVPIDSGEEMKRHDNPPDGYVKLHNGLIKNEIEGNKIKPTEIIITCKDDY